VNGDLCPACNRPLRELTLQPRGKRRCSACGLKVGRFDKWEFGPDGRPRHKDCQNPTGKKIPKSGDFSF